MAACGDAPRTAPQVVPVVASRRINRVGAMGLRAGVRPRQPELAVRACCPGNTRRNDCRAIARAELFEVRPRILHLMQQRSLLHDVAIASVSLMDMPTSSPTVFSESR